MNGHYPSAWWNALCTSFLALWVLAVVVYAPWLVVLGLIVLGVVVVLAGIILAAVFTEPRQVSEVPRDQEEKT